MKDKESGFLGKKLRSLFTADKKEKKDGKLGIRLIDEKNISDEYGVLSVPKKNIWVFNSGMTFSGNPKWLFVYINKYRPDIKAFWLCSSEETVEYVNSLGYKAYLYLSKEGIEISTAAGVYVTEQCKEIIPEHLKHCINLNLFHGVGCKTIERKLGGGRLFGRVMKKYVANNDVFINNQLFLVTSPLMEEHFKSNVGLTDDMVVRGGYPRCIYQSRYEKIATFDHDIRARKGRDEQTKVIVYSPTFREIEAYDFMGNAIPDMEKLEKKLKENNQLFVFKMHPIMLEKDSHYAQIKEKYENSPYFLFWDNNEDIYEIFDKIDVAIIDYSSIFYDFLAGGVENFIRYFFDYENSENVREGAYDYEKMTCGRMCRNFEDLLNALDNYAASEDEKVERERIRDLFWSYSEDDSMEKIIEATLSFEKKNEELPALYSFDVFDTVISRKGLHPNSIFCKVKEQMSASGLGFERYFIDSYIDIRRRCEANVREYRNKTTYVRNSEAREISFDSIFERMGILYSLSDEQIEFLKNKEIEAEFDDCIKIPETVAYVEALIDKGEDVLLISDMYLSSAVIRRMLAKFSEKIAELPIYVSCEYGVQKSTGLLFQEVYKDIEFYKYGKWIHHGDNGNSDGAKPRALGIKTEKHNIPVFNDYENRIISDIGSYDAYLVAALMARFRQRNSEERDYFSYAYVSLCLAPYAIWVVENACKRGIETLYFISRDGYHPKRIADVAIEKLGLPIKAKYIYGSRKAWRIPSFINEFDESFFLPFGNLASATTFDELLSALALDKEEFLEFFPTLADLEDAEEKVITKGQRATIVATVRASDSYRDYMLSVAARERENVDRYLIQEIDFEKKFAFVDYWGRGYTQTCLTRLLHNIKKDEFDVPYYYIRSIYPTEGHNIRYNYTSKNTSMLFVEALFSNINYKSIHEYKEDGGRMVPVIQVDECDEALLNSMEIRLCEFAADFLELDLFDRQSVLRALQDFSLEYFNANQDDQIIVNNLATLNYSVTMYGTKREYAPALTMEDVELIAEKKVPVSHITNSLAMSFSRSDESVLEHYDYLTKGKNIELKTAKKAVAKQRKVTIKDFKDRKYNFETSDKQKKENKAYNKAAADEVEDKIVIIDTYDGAQADFAPIVSFYEGKGYRIVILPLRGKYTGEELKDIATAKYLYMSNVSGWFSRVKFREETKLVQMYKEPLPISGMSQTIKIGATEDSIQRMLRIHDVEYDVVSTAGEGVTDILEKTLMKRENVKKIKDFGHPLTDIYFNEALKEKIRIKLAEILPQNGRRLMVYMPDTNGSRRFSYQYLDLAAMKKLFGEEYNILVMSNNGDDIISNYASSLGETVCSGFGILTRREAIAVADVVIGNCSAVIAETVMTGKPLYLTSGYKVKEDGSSLFTEEEINIFPLINDPYDLIPYFENRMKYDTEAYESFREKFFGSCKGRSVEQTDEYLSTL